MLFNSITYFFFIAIVFSLYWLIPARHFKAQNLLLFITSYCFYGWWDVRFLSLIFLTSSIDFFVGRAIYLQSEHRKKRYLLWICLGLNLGMLGFFKYYNFFVDSFANLLMQIGIEPHVSTLKIILPVGISFYTFQSLSYSIDIYRGKVTPTNDFVSFMTFVSFFPQLVAGPIERASELLPQFLRARLFRSDHLVSGFRYILYGLFKKMVIADRLAYFVDQVYNSTTPVDGLTYLIATFMFGFQIYCDFSGYSDIAIGSARLLGFDLMQNFKTPYFAQSFREFWHRWHISLSTWFRDYVYIPLGGNRVTETRWAINILITFTLSGLWHGASLTFVIWGFLHGLFIIVEHFLSKHFALPGNLSFVGWLITFSLVNLNWVFFRAESIEQSWAILNSFANIQSDLWQQVTANFAVNSEFREFAISLSAGLPLFFLFEFLTRKNDFNTLVVSKPLSIRWSLYFLFAAVILLLGVLTTAPQFIYFQF